MNLSASTAGAAPLREIPGEGGWPLIGQSLDYLFHLDTAIHERYRRFGEVSWGQAFGTRAIALLGPDANRDHEVAKPARKCCTLHEPEQPREPCWFRAAEATPGDSFLD